jgi:hypothetical protein
MDWRGRAQHKREQGMVSQLVSEAEAFLSGRYLEVARTSGRGVPGWIQCNWIAHAPPEEIVVAAGDPSGSVVRLGSWAWAVRALSEEMVGLTAAETGAIGDLQRGCLVPLELTLMQPAFASILPAEVLSLAVTRLRAHPCPGRRGMPVPPGEEP